jgi:dimethylargininase
MMQPAKPRFRNAVVRTPGRSMVNGITSSRLGKPDHSLALEQHDAYVGALRSCGLEVHVLDADENYPDSTFVEDTALLTPHCAIITNPGAESRKGETASIRAALQPFYANIEEITSPGTVEGGDIMMVGDHYYIGLSDRTNPDGAAQVIAVLEKYGFSGSAVTFTGMLHLKTGLAYLENNTIAACAAIIAHPVFQQYQLLAITDEEAYAANCIWVNGAVLIPAGFPKTTAIIQKAGYPTIELNMSEFQKLDGGLSCLSLRF